MTAAAGVLDVSAGVIPHQQVMRGPLGLAPSPGRIAIMLLIPVVLVEVVQPCSAFWFWGSALFHQHVITADVDFRTLVIVRTTQSARLDFLLVPINFRSADKIRCEAVSSS
jgi:MFS transporter, DHA2 family, multidrug resistance protein